MRPESIVCLLRRNFLACLAATDFPSGFARFEGPVVSGGDAFPNWGTALRRGDCVYIHPVLGQVKRQVESVTKIEQRAGRLPRIAYRPGNVALHLPLVPTNCQPESSY